MKNRRSQFSLLISWLIEVKDISHSPVQALGRPDTEENSGGKSEVRWTAKRDSEWARELQTEALSSAEWPAESWNAAADHWCVIQMLSRQGQIDPYPFALLPVKWRWAWTDGKQAGSKFDTRSNVKGWRFVSLLHWIGSLRVNTAGPTWAQAGIMGKRNKNSDSKWQCCNKNWREREEPPVCSYFTPAADFCHAQTFVGLFYEHSDCWWCWTDNFQTFGVVCCRPRLFSFGVLSASAFENRPEGPPKKDTACLFVPDQSLIRYSWTELWKYPISLEINVRLCWGVGG